MNKLHFIVWGDGDRTVGDYGETADVIFAHTLDTDETREAAREVLREAFRTILDDRSVHVMTASEFARKFARKDDE